MTGKTRMMRNYSIQRAGPFPHLPLKGSIDLTYRCDFNCRHCWLRIPPGACVTYGDLAKAVGAPKASRAVGAAVGANMISLLIPCHRVILSSGIVHNYRWGAARKQAILAMEEAMTSAA